LAEAVGSCPTITAARLAGQIMATTGFESTSQRGIAGLTAEEWEVWKPWNDASPSDERANVLALAHLTCDLIGHLRRAGFPGDTWRLAIAAFGSSLEEVRSERGEPAHVVEFVDRAETYADWYAAQFGEQPRRPAQPTTIDTTTTTAPTDRATLTGTTPLPLNYPSFTDAGGLHLNGSARLVDGRLYLTTGLEQAGSAWAQQPIDTSRSFSTTFQAIISAPTDGLALVIQGEGPTALGGPGNGLGYGAAPIDDPADVIRPSVAIEIDSWDNGLDGFDPGDQHLALTVDGDVTRHLVWAPTGFELSNNQPFHVWVTYDAETGALSVYASPNGTPPTQPLFVDTIDLRSHLGTDRAYIGFTGGTGNTNLTDSWEAVLSWSLSSS
jgi:hypothetical protein